MERLFLLVLFYFVLIFSSAQISKLDSLKLVVKNSEGQRKVKELNKLSGKYAFKDFDSALYYIEKAIEIAKTNHYDSLCIEAYNVKGIIYDIREITDSAEYYFLKTYNLSIEKNVPTYERFSINNLGMMYWRRGDFNKALEFFFKALRFAEDLNKIKFETVALNNIVLIYQEMKQYNKALEYHKKTLAIRKELKMIDDLTNSYNNIGICYKELNQVDSSILYYHKAIEFAKKTSNDVEECTALSNLGSLYLKNKDYHKAETCLFNSLQIEGINPKSIMTNNLNLSGVYYGLKQYHKGIKHGLVAKKWIEDNANLALGADVYKYLALNYAAIGQNNLSFDYLLQWETLKDSVFSEYNADAINRLEIAFETEKKEKALLKEQAENERLQKEKALTEIRLYNRNKWIIGIISTSLILILFILFISQRNKRKAQAEKDSAIIKEREKGLKAVFNAQEDERKRIAKDLHDGIGQQISAIKMFFQSLTKGIVETKPELKEDISKVEKMITDTGTDIRNISHQMMPKALTEVGLTEALEDLLENCFFKTDVIYNFEHFGFEKRLPSNVEIALYRIAQELLQNIIKHSGAKNVDVQLSKMERYCILIVEDDGEGISESDSSDGIGMMNINNRLSTINGNMNMDSEKGEGTTATIRIALV